ncbi:hypothetical protein ColTof4_10449 [Colletotrichum tofieldiae]|nr:hypothetical protein ColTof3_05896 [Colletotrichum tofieldiae]GKT78026.1 hypothetical protein ColTof4_10449 [Colletotrichum tofieldiae]GKT84653.1 hypothetical protein Ct61P_02503 [Colletotrichum tofieldiae]
MTMFDAAALRNDEDKRQSAPSRGMGREGRGVSGRFQFGPDDGFMGTAKGGAAIDRGAEG